MATFLWFVVSLVGNLCRSPQSLRRPPPLLLTCGVSVKLLPAGGYAGS
jgi:hypothetical protein